LVGLLASSPAWAVMAFLQNSRLVNTVSGQVAWECLYNVPGHGSYTMLVPISRGTCPPSIEVE
jgi:hypothetical protein